MSLTLQTLWERLQHATHPEDIFGSLTGDQRRMLKRRYHELVTMAHPDRNPAQSALAHDVCARLQVWYEAALRQVGQGLYGVTPRISATTHKHSYIGYAAPLLGDLCELFPVDVAAEQVLLKVVLKASNNDLLQAEAQSLRRINREMEGQKLREHFPTLIEDLMLRDMAGVQRHINVLRAEADYVSLAAVLHAYPTGLHPADAAWMFNRLLVGLNVTHQLGLVHGAVTPSHVLIRPSDHNGMLIDWCYSVTSGTALKAKSPAYAIDYPPEVDARQPATPATDIYMAARCMLRLLGGNPVTAEIPPQVPKAIRLLLRACLIPSPQRRASDAWQVFEDFQDILGNLYGPPTFRPFHMPTLI